MSQAPRNDPLHEALECGGDEFGPGYAAVAVSIAPAEAGHPALHVAV